MICPTCSADPCACLAKPEPAPPPRAFQLKPAYDYSQAITKEQFGVDLFDCIKAFSGRNYCRAMRVILTHDQQLSDTERTRRLADFARKETAANRDASRLIQLLPSAHQRAILARYEAQPLPTASKK